MRRFFANPLLGLAGLVLLAGCSKDMGVASVLVVATVQVDPPSGSVVLGQTLQLTATPKTEGGIPLPAHDVVWSSTDVAKATVSSDGVVTGHSVGGPVRIRATVDGVTGETQITVLPVPVDHIVVTPPSNNIMVGQQVPLTATAYDAANNVLSGRTFSWSSAAPGTVAVTSTGLALGMAPGGPVLITAAADGKSDDASVTVTQRPATRLGFLQQPGAAVAGQVLAPPIRIAVQDDGLGTVGGATNSVTIALANNPGGATLSGTRTVAAVNGVATFANLALDRAGNGYTLVATSAGLISAISNSFNVTAGAGTAITFTTAPPATARSGIALTANPVIQVRDGSGNPVAAAGIQITAAISGASATLSGTTTATTAASGAATFSGLIISGPVGSYTLSFSSPGLTTLTSGAIALTAGTAASIGITTQPAATARSGIALSPQPVVRLLDAAGNPVSLAAVLITAAIQTGPAGSTLGGTTAIATNGSGIATFTNLAVNGSAGSYTLRFSTPGLTAAVSNTIVLGAGTGSILAITTQPSAQASSGRAFTQQPVIQLLDAAGNPVLQAGVNLTASIQSGGGALGGTVTVATNGSGIATFTNLSLTGTVGSRTLLFSATGYTPIGSGTIALGPGAAAKLALTSQPSAAAQSGAAFAQQPVVQVQDASGNPVAQAGVPVTASKASGPAGGTLGGTAVATTDANGTATWTNLSVTGPSGAYTIGFAAPTLTGVTSNPVTLGAGAGTGLSIVTQPASAAVNGAVFSTQPVIQVIDGSGNPAPQAGVPVTVALSAGGGGTLGGLNLTVNTDAAGRAAFGGLSITGKAGNYSLTFTAPNLGAGVTSGTIGLTAGPAAVVVIVTQPSATASSGAPFGVQPVVQVQDGSGNAVSGASVTAAIASGSGTLGGTATVVTDVNGAAAYSDLSITGTAGAFTLSFTAAPAPPATSSQITLGAGGASALSVTSQPSSTAQSGVAFPQQPVVQVTDGSGNPVSGVVVTVTIASGGGNLGGTTTATSDPSGNATFTNLSISGTVGLHNLGFSAAGTPGTTSANINLVAGPASQLVIVQEPSTSAVHNNPFAQQPIIRVLDASSNLVPNATVTVAIHTVVSGSGKLAGTLTAVTDASGIATFINLSITKAGRYILGFSSNGITVVSLVTITIL